MTGGTEAGPGSGTSGGPAGTGGGRPVTLLALFAALTLAIAAVNALSVGHERASAGQALPPWAPWVWEITSALFWIAMLLPLAAFTRRLRRLGDGVRGLALALLVLAAASVPVSLLHVVWLWASRSAAYALLGEAYGHQWVWAELLYEWRKDLISVLAIAGIILAFDRWGSATAPPATASARPFRLEVRDGARTHWLAPAEIERVEAAGNYVELHGPSGPVLHRATLVATAEMLAPHGFVRVHRSRLVRADAITAARTLTSGDQELTLASGAVVMASRRYRLRA